MDITREEQQRQEFRNILFDLSKSQLSLKDKGERSKIYQRLEKLYDSPDDEKEFRHFYSDIFLVLNQIELGDQSGSIDILGQNLYEIRKGYQALNKAQDGSQIDISDSIRKLYDHVSLDIARMRYSDATKWQLTNGEALANIQSQVTQIENVVEKTKQSQQQAKLEFDLQQSQLLSEIEQLNEDIVYAQKAQQSVENELVNQQREYIAILGIFAAVVLAFTGGIAFSTSVLNNIAQASIYRTIFVSLIIGLVLINVLFGLFYYMNFLVNKDRKVFPLIISNGVVVFLLLLTAVAWNFGWVEARDERISTKSNISIEKVRDSSKSIEITDTEKTTSPR